MLDMTNEWSFPIQTQPIYDINGEPIEGHKAVMRTDTNEVLGVHGSRYQMVSHDTVVNSIMDAVNEADISRDYQLKTSIIDGGRKMRGEILFRDLTVEPQVGDFVQFQVSFLS